MKSDTRMLCRTIDSRFLIFYHTKYVQYRTCHRAQFRMKKQRSRCYFWKNHRSWHDEKDRRWNREAWNPWIHYHKSSWRSRHKRSEQVGECKIWEPSCLLRVSSRFCYSYSIMSDYIFSRWERMGTMRSYPVPERVYTHHRTSRKMSEVWCTDSILKTLSDSRHISILTSHGTLIHIECNWSKDSTGKMSRMSDCRNQGNVRIIVKKIWFLFYSLYYRNG